jgi:hypothetical protein
LNHIPQFYRSESLQAPATTAMYSYGRQSYDPHLSMQTGTTTSLLRTAQDVTTMSPSYGHQSYDGYQSIPTGTTTSLLRSGTPEPAALGMGSTSGGSSRTPKGSLVPTELRPVNIIHHDDAGAVDEEDHIPETIELPPAYSNIRNNVA